MSSCNLNTRFAGVDYESNYLVIRCLICIYLPLVVIQHRCLLWINNVNLLHIHIIKYKITYQITIIDL